MISLNLGQFRCVSQVLVEVLSIYYVIDRWACKTKAQTGSEKRSPQLAYSDIGGATSRTQLVSANENGRL